jgi:hypothetical protein
LQQLPFPDRYGQQTLLFQFPLPELLSLAFGFLRRFAGQHLSHPGRYDRASHVLVRDLIVFPVKQVSRIERKVTSDVYVLQEISAARCR